MFNTIEELMKLLKQIESFISAAVNVAMVGLFIIMLCLAATQVFLRFFFNGSILWGDVAARNLVIWVGFLGASIATRQNKHFHIDVLTRLIKPALQRWFFSFANLFSALVCYYLAQASVAFVVSEEGNTTFLEIPIMYLEVIIPVSFYIMMVQFAIRTVTSFSPDIQSSTEIQQEA